MRTIAVVDEVRGGLAAALEQVDKTEEVLLAIRLAEALAYADDRLAVLRSLLP